MIKVEAGTYDGVTEAATIYEAPSGAVMCRMEIEVNGTRLSGGICLVQKDGTLSERGFKDVQTIFGWSDWDWSRWEGEPESFAGAAVQVVVETVQGEKSEFSSIKYINPPGGGAQKLEKANAKGLAAKYGAKTRALFGGSSASAGPTAGRPAAKPTPPAPRSAPAAPAKKAVKPSTMEACWDEFCKEKAGVPEHELYALWPERIAEACPGKTQNDLTPEDWGTVYATFDCLPL